MELFKHQKDALNEAYSVLKTSQRVLIQASTGAGKTVMFSKLTELLTQQGKKVFILVNRKELLEQTCHKMDKFRLSYTTVTAKTKQFNTEPKVVVCMVESFYNRVKKGMITIPDGSILIIDECHLGVMDKCLNFFNSGKVIGFTATPLRKIRVKYHECYDCGNVYTDDEFSGECECSGMMMGKTKPFNMASLYKKIVVCKPIRELIEEGYLVDERIDEYQINSTIKEKLDEVERAKEKSNSSSDFDDELLSQLYTSDEALETVYQMCLKYQDTNIIIFNANSTVNKVVTDHLREKGINIKSYDSVNNKPNERESTVNWFNNNKGAVLSNVNCFTTGMDSEIIQTVIINRATLSLSLWLQMVGRGSRPARTIKMLKDFFNVVDLGGNVHRHKPWSWEHNYHSIFEKGIGKENSLDDWTCEQCGWRNIYTNKQCENGCEKPKASGNKEENNKKHVLGRMVVVKGLKAPDEALINKMINTAKQKGLTVDDVLENFSFYCQTYFDDYTKQKEKIFDIDKKLRKKIDDNLRKLFAQIVFFSDLPKKKETKDYLYKPFRNKLINKFKKINKTWKSVIATK